MTRGRSPSIPVLRPSPGRPDLTAKCHLIELVPYLGCLYIGLSHFGLAGAAAAFSARALADFLLLASLAGILQGVAARLIMPTLLLTCAYALSLGVDFDSRGTVAALVTFLLVVGGWAYRRTGQLISDSPGGSLRSLFN